MPPQNEKNGKELFESGMRDYGAQNFEAALESFTKAIEFDANLCEAFYYRALSKTHIYQLGRDQHQFGELIELLKSSLDDVSEAMRLNPAYVDAYLLRSDLFITFNMQFDNAADHLQTVLKMAPNSVPALMKLAGIFSHPFFKRHSEALSLVRRAAAVDPSNETVISMQYQLNRSLGHKKEALVDLAFLIAKNPDNATHYVDRAELLEQLQECETALDNWNHACQISDEWRLLRSEFHMLHQRYELAEKDLLHIAGSGDPHFQHFPHMKLTTLYVGLERFDKALEQVDTLLKLGPATMMTSYFLVRSFIHLRLGNSEMALQDGNQALSRIEEEEVQLSDMFGGIENNLTFQQNKARALINRGAVYWHKEDRKLAVHDFEGAYNVLSSPKVNGAIGKLGETFMSIEDYQSAERIFSEVIMANPESERAYFQRGKALMKLKMFDKAIADLSKCIQLQPNHADALNARAEVYELQHQDALAGADRRIAAEASAQNHSLPEKFNEWALFHGDGGFFR